MRLMLVHKDDDYTIPHHNFRIGREVWVCHFRIGRLVLASYERMV